LIKYFPLSLILKLLVVTWSIAPLGVTPMARGACGEANRESYIAIFIDRPIDDFETGAVLASSVIKAIDLAINRKVENVVFILDTPGGSVESVCRIAKAMAERSGKVRFHARVKRALSAGIWIALSCDEIWAEPDAVMGAAVAYARGQNDEISVDEKMNSALAAQLGAYMSAKGRPADLARAMVMRGAELWVTKQPDGRCLLSGSPPPQGSVGERIDSAETVLTMTGSEMARLGIAKPVSDMPISGPDGWQSDGLAHITLEETDRVFKLPWFKSAAANQWATRPAWGRNGNGQVDPSEWIFQTPPQDPYTIVLNIGERPPPPGASGRSIPLGYNIKAVSLSKAKRAWEQFQRSVNALCECDPLLLPLSGISNPSQALKDFEKRKLQTEAEWKRVSKAADDIYLNGSPFMSVLPFKAPSTRLQSAWNSELARLRNAASLEMRK
jgi:ATP-dependent protease ClpP protease subunit